MVFKRKIYNHFLEWKKNWAGNVVNPSSWTKELDMDE